MCIRDRDGVEQIRNSKNEITLQLSDGTIKPISEENNGSIVESDGHRVGLQNGKQLIYHRASTSRELAYNTLRVPYGKRFMLILADGTKVHLNSGTTLRSVSYT